MRWLAILIVFAFIASLSVITAGRATADGEDKPAKTDKTEKKKRTEPKPSKKKTSDGEAEGLGPAEEEFRKLKAQFEAEAEKDPTDRILTILKFGDKPAAGTVVFLTDVLKGGKEPAGICGAVVHALGRVGTAEAIAAAFQLGVPRLVGDASIYELRTALSYPLRREAEEWLIKKGLTEVIRKDKEAFRIVIAAIARFKSDKRTQLLKVELKKAADVEVKTQILDLLGQMEIPDGGKVGYPFLRDPDLKVQLAALRLLLSARAKDHSKDYQALLKSPQWEVRALAVELVALVAAPGTVKLLDPLLADPEPRVRIAVVQTLAANASEEVIEPLIRALSKNEARVLDDLIDVLTRLTGKSFGASAAQWESWWAGNKGNVEIRRRPGSDLVQLQEKAAGELKTAVASYFGLRVVSKNIAFVIDTSESMSEGYVPLAEVEKVVEPKPEPKAEPDPETPRDPGKTVPLPRKRKPSAKARAAAEEAKSKSLTPKLDVAKSELLKVLQGLPTGVKANIVTFNSLIDAWKPALTILDPLSKPEAEQFVTALKPEGLTNLYGAMEEAFKDPSLDTIYLLSDGAPTVGTYIEADDVLRAVAGINQLRKVKINAIGFHMQPHEQKFLERLAEENYGTFRMR